MEALVVGHHHDGDPGLVGTRLMERGFALRPLHREATGAWPSDQRGDLLVLLGSDWSVYCDHVADEVASERALLQRWMDRGAPVLAICFGAQVLTTALGGSVSRSAVAEVGWHGIEPMHPAIVAGPWLQWHYDVCDLSAARMGGSGERPELLAANAVGPQAFRIGRSLATQFHPEATSDIVERWSCDAGSQELERLGIDRADLLTRTRAEIPAATDRAYALVDWFLEEFVGSKMSPT